MQHTLNLAPIYFELISSGEKVLEGRLNDEKRQAFEIGDEILFFKEPEKKETLRAEILDKYFFKDFEEMAESLDKAELGFDGKTKEQMIDTYYGIYPKEKTLATGVVIFRIKKLN